ncbi:SCO2322 family protein [Actinopolymorpha sp. B17G11]|uniref:SCO2322 family protein n=1 Tax=unclassified Actinopolymorpha TaxID=2627063 RepID=UPI0032D8E096
MRSEIRRRRRAGLLYATLAVPFFVVLCAAVLAAVLAAGTGTAHADAYRFWGFYQWQDDAWALAKSGPSGVTPKDGAVEGWRLAVSGEKTPPRLPRAAGDFDQICGSTPAETGKKRVAVVVDYGLAGEAEGEPEPPDARGACAVVDAKASSAQVLAAIGEVREQKGLVCAIDDFPATGCGDAVDSVPEFPTPEPSVSLALPAAAAPAGDSSPAESSETAASADAESDGFPVLPVAAVAVVVVLIVGGFMIRRQRNADAGSAG